MSGILDDMTNVAESAAVPEGATGSVATDPLLSDPYGLITVEAAGVLLAGAPWRRFAMVGDSTAEGIREAVAGYPDLGWMDWISAGLAATRPDVVSLNLGRGGATTAQIRAEQAERALAFAPDLVAVGAGANDLMRREFDAAAVEAEFDALVAGFRAVGATVLTAGMFDFTRAGLVPAKYVESTRERLLELTALVTRVTARHGAAMVNYTTHPASADPAVWSSDGLHLNARGHAVAGTVAVTALADHLRWTAALAQPANPTTPWLPVSSGGAGRGCRR